MITNLLWIVACVGSLLMYGISLYVAYSCGYTDAKLKYEQPELCSHGYEWDDCPDCCH